MLLARVHMSLRMSCAGAACPLTRAASAHPVPGLPCRPRPKQGADFLVHYGHSCLVPVDVTSMPCLYVFVDIQMDTQHLVETVRCAGRPQHLVETVRCAGGLAQRAQAGGGAGPLAAARCSTTSTPRASPLLVPCTAASACRHNFPAGSRLVLAGTIQFASCLQSARQQLAAEYPSITVPQARRQGRGGDCRVGRVSCDQMLQIGTRPERA